MSVRTNFRGLRALLMMAPEANAETLQRTLERLGLVATLCDPAETAPPACDIVFFDADVGCVDLGAHIPHVALIGLEAPSRLIKVARQRCVAHVIKPVRNTGVFAALLIGFNEQASRERDLQAHEQMARRVQGRRMLFKAILRLMEEEGLDDDQAYNRLRLGSMHRRISVEDYAAELMNTLPPRANRGAERP